MRQISNRAERLDGANVLIEQGIRLESRTPRGEQESRQNTDRQKMAGTLLHNRQSCREVIEVDLNAIGMMKQVSRWVGEAL